jgi:HlyD family secretion protein
MPWKSILIGIALVAIIAAATGFFSKFERATTVQLPGVVEIQEVRLGSKIGGRVAEVLVREGETVDAGQLLVSFEAPELEAQLLQQQARLAAAEADLEKARNGPREEEIRQTKSDLESAEADLKLAEQDFDRAESLVPNALSRSEFDAKRAALSRSRGRVGSNQAHFDLLLAGTRAEDIALAAANASEARGKLQEIQADLAEKRVVAPEKVLVQVVTVRKGDLVPANQAVIRVLRMEDQWVKVYVPETELGRVHLNEQVSVTCDADPDRRFEGTVFQISSESEFTPRNVQSIRERRFQVFGIKVRVHDTEGVFKPGMAADVIFDIPRSSNSAQPRGPGTGST